MDETGIVYDVVLHHDCMEFTVRNLAQPFFKGISQHNVQAITKIITLLVHVQVVGQ